MFHRDEEKLCKKKIRVMHILALGGYSGAENVAISIISNTKELCDSVYVSPSGSIDEVLADNGIEHFVIEKSNIRNIKYAIDKIQPDIIHAHDFTNSVFAALTLTKIPIISHLHNNPPWIKRRGVKSILYAFVSHKYKKIFVVSDAVINEYVYGKCIRKKSLIIGNPIDIKKIKDLSDENDHEKRFRIAFLGRLSRPKNPMKFVRIIDELKKTVKEIKTVMIGDGELRNEVEDAILRNGLESNIYLAGFQSNPYKLLQSADVLCMTSDWEGYGLAAVEALALGLPVVCTSVGGLRGIVNYSCGMLCDTEAEIVSALNKILTNSVLLEELVQGAFRRAKELDNLEEYMDNMKGCYIELCQEKN